MRTKSIVAAALTALAALSAQACGFCIEDRVAAVWDNAMVESAMAKHRHVAFLAADGDIAIDAAERNAVVTALERAGAIRGLMRCAPENAAFAVTFDPKRTTLAQLVAAGDRALASRNRSVTALRIIDAGGKLRDP